jgi:hypothetical protein
MESGNETLEKEYDFFGKNPNDVLTRDEFEHFDEGMRLKNQSKPADRVDFQKAALSVAEDLDSLLP